MHSFPSKSQSTLIMNINTCRSRQIRHVYHVP